MASVSKRSAGTRADYLVRWRDPDGRQRKKVFTRKGDADRHAATVEADKARGTYVAADLGRMSFAEYAQEWARIQQHRPGTADLVERHLRRHLLPVLGSRPLGAVRPSEVQAFVKGLSEQLSPSTVAVVYSRVAAIFAAAVRDRRIPSTPCVGITLPRRARIRVEPLPTAAVRALAGAVPGRYRALVLLAAGTGLRQGECFGLGAEHIDFLRRVVWVERQLVTIGGQGPHLGPPKTDASVRRCRCLRWSSRSWPRTTRPTRRDSGGWSSQRRPGDRSGGRRGRRRGRLRRRVPVYQRGRAFTRYATPTRAC